MEIRNPKKPLIYYAIIAVCIVMLLNTFVFPFLLRQQVTQVDYGTFLRLIDENRVKRVEVQDRQIVFVAADK